MQEEGLDGSTHMIIFLVYDDANPVWAAVRGIYNDREDAMQHAKDITSTDYNFIPDENRWENKYGSSVWIEKRVVE